MENVNSILLIAQVVLSVILIALVLMQHGKGADAGAAFGSGTSASVFGARGSGNFLSKLTAYVATLFFVVCLSLAYFAINRETISSSVTAIEVEQAQQTSNENSDLPPAIDAVDNPVESDLPAIE